MSTLIKRMLCDHKWRGVDYKFLVCDNCGKIKKIPCAHEWNTYSKEEYWTTNDSGRPCTRTRATLICKNCGQIKQISL